MAPSVSAGHNRRGIKNVKAHSSRTTSGHRSRKALDEDGEAKKPEKPDVDELRRRRAAYFARPVAERQKIIRPKTSPVESGATKSRATEDSERRRKKRGHGTSSKATKSSSERHRQDAKNGEYVYAPRASTVEKQPPPQTEIRPDERRSHESSDARRHARHSSHHSHSPSRRDSAEREVEPEVTPDDSISVVAERRVSASRTSSGTSRPHLKRSHTTSAKLESIVEKEDAPSLTSSRRTSKRESTLLGSLLRRQSTTSVPVAPRLVECLTCGSDDVPYAQSAKLACSHRMCHECLSRVFEMSVKDPAHMPPKCCTDDHIPLKHVDKLFDVKFKMLWNRKYQEYNTKNRIYCPAPKCGEWIKPSHIHRDGQGRKYAQCPRCKIKVCTLCNNKMHRSRDCPQDPEIAKLVEQAKEKGWQRCFSCSSMVELKEGCNHMTCRCTAEFCMKCGAKWKTCECPWFQYANMPTPDRLMEMRVPEPIQVIYRRVYNAANHAAAQPAQPAVQRQPEPPQELTYAEQIQRRRQQERLDEDLARRLQLASLMVPGDGSRPQRRAHVETWGLGNAAGHSLNDDFVQNAANVVMSAFGDASLGRRGDRASGRRRRARQTEQTAGDAGLAPNFLGDESVLGVSPAARPARAAV